MSRYKKEYQKEWYLKNREHRNEYQKEWRLQNKEYDKEYYLKNKEKIKEQKKEYFSRPEIKEHRAKYRLKNIEKINKQKKEWYLKNTEKIKKQKKEYNSRPETKEWRRGYDKNRRLTDPNFRIVDSLRSRLYNALKGENKSASTMKLLGCTIDELWTHLESKFEPWMTKENYGRGGWDVDHIKSVTKFDLTDPEQQHICFHWSNLQPMEHIANIKKGTR